MTEKNMVNRFISIAAAILLFIGMAEGSCVSSYAAVKKPAKVKISSLKASGLKMTLKWKKAKNAKKYQVYMRSGSHAWKLKKTLKKRVITITGKEGATYRFKVRGINGKKKGSFSTVKKISIPKKEEPIEPEPEEPEHEKTPLEIAADKVTEMILALPVLSDIKETDQEAIAAARKAYDRLPGGAKVFVKEETLAVLEAAERRLNEFPAENAAALIEDLPDPDQMSVNVIERIQEAIAAYNALTDEQKTIIPDDIYEKLRSVADRLPELIAQREDCAAANRVSKRIMKFWDIEEVRYSDRNELRNIRKAYEELTDAQKEYVDREYTLTVLEAAEAKVAEIAAVIDGYLVKWPKVTIGGVEYYKAVEEGNRVLLISCDRAVDPDGNYVSLSFGDTNIWRDSNVRSWLNSDYLRDHPAIGDMVLETEITTRKLQTYEDKLEPEYITTTDKVFVLSTYDINGGASSDLEYTNGSSVIPGLEKEKYINSKGQEWDISDLLLPPKERYDETNNMSWTRTPVVFYLAEEGPYYEQQDAYSTYFVHGDPYWPYKNIEINRMSLEYEYGVQPAMWVDRAKLEEAEQEA